MTIQIKISFFVGLLIGIITGLRSLSYLKKQYREIFADSKIYLINVGISIFTILIFTNLFNIIIGILIKILENFLGVSTAHSDAGIVYITMIWPIAFIISIIIVFSLSPISRRLMHKLVKNMIK